MLDAKRAFLAVFLRVGRRDRLVGAQGAARGPSRDAVPRTGDFRRPALDLPAEFAGGATG